MKTVLAWLDERTGWKNLLRETFCANIPGGPRWCNVFGGAVVFAIAIQFITGICLWLDYSPSAQTAWESVNYIQHEMSGGWLLRGLHHYTAQILPVLLAAHLLQVIVRGAYRAPREVNFWLGLILLQLVLALALTGYQLPWDQKGFSATKVNLNLLGIVPLIGPPLQKILIGGAEYGHLTLTRFFALHAGVLPLTVLAVLLARAYLLRRHGYAGQTSPTRADAQFWPDQALRNAVACLAVMAALLFLIVRHRLASPSGPLGAPLGPPADPSEPYSAARPEWYFLFLYQFLKYFPGDSEIWGAIVIPGLAMAILFLMPFIGKSTGGRRFNVAFISFIFAGAAVLTYLALATDAKDSRYQTALKQSAREAARAEDLARSPSGIPSAGAAAMLRDDAFVQGPKLFAKNCASCHRYNGHDGTGNIPHDPQAASDLAGYGSRAWITGLLDPTRITSTNYFGATKFKGGKMSKFVRKDVAAYTPEQKEQLGKVIAAVSAEAGLKSQATDDKRDAALIAEGRKLFKDAMACTDCHQFHAKDEDATAPNLTGYASREWLIKFLNNPAHDDFYGQRNDRMPAFGEKQILSPQEIGLIVDWLRGDWYEPASVQGAR